MIHPVPFTGLLAVWLEPRRLYLRLKPNSGKPGGTGLNLVARRSTQPGMNAGPSTASRKTPVNRANRQPQEMFAARASPSRFPATSVTENDS